MPLTKIVCTLGPATESPEVLRAMMRAGMTVARLNFSHGDADGKRAMTALVRRVAEEEGRYVALMGDLQGPKIRVGQLPEAGMVLVEGETVALTTEAIRDPLHEIPFPHPDVMPDIAPGDRLLLDDGSLELEAMSITPAHITCRVIIGGVLTSHKGVNLPGVSLKISALTDKDKADALLALELDLDYLALSFVRRASEIDDLRSYLREHANIPTARAADENPHYIPGIVAKIEKPEALEDLNAIVRTADAVMVARGDLGVETAPEHVPVAQKRIIALCNRVSKPVITATQMLQSMIESPRPTRAEASDVANAILDGSDAVMLSGETSIGAYPVEAVQMMARIAESVERSGSFPYNQLLGHTPWAEELPNSTLISAAVSRATVMLAQAAQASALITSTDSGRTPRMVARHRPHMPLVGVTPFVKTARRLQMIWGVVPVVVPTFRNTDEMLQAMIRTAMTHGYAGANDNIILTAGIPLEVHGVTNMVKVHTIREADLGGETSG